MQNETIANMELLHATHLIEEYKNSIDKDLSNLVKQIPW